MSTTSKFNPCGYARNGLKIRVYRVRLTAWAQKSNVPRDPRRLAHAVFTGRMSLKDALAIAGGAA